MVFLKRCCNFLCSATSRERSCLRCSIVAAFSSPLTSRRRAFCSAVAFAVGNNLRRICTRSITSRTTQLALQLVVVTLDTLQLKLHIFHIGLGSSHLKQDVLLLPLSTGLLDGEDSQTAALRLEVLFQVRYCLFRLVQLLRIRVYQRSIHPMKREGSHTSRTPVLALSCLRSFCSARSLTSCICWLRRFAASLRTALSPSSCRRSSCHWFFIEPSSRFTARSSSLRVS